MSSYIELQIFKKKKYINIDPRLKKKLTDTVHSKSTESTSRNTDSLLAGRKEPELNTLFLLIQVSDEQLRGC